jgi:hypothetical protein
MGAYHQMGHDSENLLTEPGLSAYRGAILSPCNYPEAALAAQIAAAAQRENFETIFDPQLYFPRTDHARLRQWAYFPTDVETADLADIGWWSGVVDGLVQVCETLRPTAICSPAIVPRAYSDDYYALTVEIGLLLDERLRACGVQTLQTAIISAGDIATPGRAREIASILTATAADQVYLILQSELEPRREFGDPEPLKGIMRLIAALREAGRMVLVGFCSSDMVLWKAAGATSVATGKFFNLRRFTSSRFDPPAGGGGQVPYWFEESLLAFLRQSDLIRVRAQEMLSEASSRNPFGQAILAQDPSAPWLGMGWRQFMAWFADIEERLNAGEPLRPLLRAAERNWETLEANDVLMEESRNNGSWVRQWHRALLEYRTF